MEYTTHTDETLARMSADGDTLAFQELTRRYLKHAFNFVRQYVREQEGAEDITQDAFLKAWKHISRFKPGYSFKPWLFTIARNTALDYIKKKKSIAFSSIEGDEDEGSFAETIPDAGPLPNEIYADKELGSMLDEAMKILPPEHRAVVVMHYREDMTFEEIAKIIKKPMNTVKSWHRRSLLKIRDKLMHLK
jgi:RNA polymerase sigma-70 factor (ECF subfamily)